MNFGRRVVTRLGWLAVSCVFACWLGAARTSAQTVTANAAQQIVFAGLRSVAAKGQINAIGTDAAGDVYLAFDQGDGVRVLKVAGDGGALLAQVKLGGVGDSAVALAVDAAGDIYIAGTSTSGSLEATTGAAVSSASAGTTNSFLAKFDGELTELFLTFTGGTRIAASAVAASGDRVFVTGITYAADLPVSANAVEPAPATGSLQNGFAEAFSADGTSLEYATYVTGALGDTTPTGIAVDASNNAWLVGSTTASGFPTAAAVVPEMLSTPSGFLLQLTPAGDGIVYSTFVPGAGLTSVSLDSTGLNLLVSGQVALGQFPVDTVSGPLVPTVYQVLLRISLDGSTVQSGTVIAPGLQSVVAAAAGGGAWIGGTFPSGVAPLLPQSALSTIGNGYAVRVTPGSGVDETVRFGGLANFDQTYASVPVGVNGLAVDGTGALFLGGSVQPTASADLLSTETYDFPLRAGPTAALPSLISGAEPSSASCEGSLCSGSGGYLAKVDPVSAGPALTFSADGIPWVTLRNLGSVAAQGLQLSTDTGTLSTNCGSDLAPAGECDLLLAGGGGGTLRAADSNGGSTSVAFGSYSPAGTSNGIVFAPKELDFGIQTAASNAGLRTITITNLGSSVATFSEGITRTPESSTPFSEVSSTCPLAGNTVQKMLVAGATCTITVGFSAMRGSSNDGFVEGEWTIGPGEVFLTGYSQAASLSVSASEIDFGTEFQGGLELPRYLYLSNASDSPQDHTAVAAASNSPFTVTDECPASIGPKTVCRLRIDYQSAVVPSSDSLTLTLDEGLSVLLTGQTMPSQTVGGSTLTSSLTVSPAAVTFGNAVAVTGVSSATQTVSVTNNAATATPVSIAVSGDFSEVTSCGSSLAAGASCAVVITFTPSQPGVRQGLLSVGSGAGASPVPVALRGVGTGILAANNGTLDLGESPVGQPVVQSYKVTQAFDSLSLQATGPYLVTLIEDTGFGFGNPPSSAYVRSGSGTCHNCWVGVRFQPTASGEQVGSLSFSSDPGGLPYTIQLTGAGIATTGLMMSPSFDDFGTVPVNSVSGAALVTLTNLASSGAAVTISAISVSGSFSVALSTGAAGCAGSLAYAASCSVWVQFAPTATGTSNGSLSINTSAGVASATLTGTGTADPGVAISPLSLTFANLPSGVSQGQNVSIQNTRAQSVSIGAPTTLTANFTVASNCGSLAPGASCSLQVSFAAGSSPITDVLSIPVTTSGSGGIPDTQTYRVNLSGEVTSQNQGLAVSPATLLFGPVATSTLGSVRQVEVTNLTTRKVTLSVTMPRSYELQGNGCATLEPNTSCVLTVLFVPLENGDLPGTISVTASAQDGSGSQTGLIYADGFGVGTGALTVTGGLIVDGVFNFGSVPAGQNASQQFTLSNSGAQAITIRRTSSQPPFLSTTNCGGILLPASSCTVSVTYSPGMDGSNVGSSTSEKDLGSLIVESDAQSSPNIVDLEGQPSAGVGTGQASGLASFSLSQSALSFGTTTVGDTSPPQNLILTNTGTIALQVSSVSTATGFTVQNGCAVVSPGSSCTILVWSSPQSVGTLVSSVEIASNAADSLEYVTLIGIGASSPLMFSPASLSFGSVLMGASSTLPLQVTNAGSSAITFSSITGSGEFAVTGTCPTGGLALGAQTTCTEQVTFQPAAAGPASGLVAFNTSASTGPISVPANGTGVQAELIATPASLAFGSVQSGTSASLPLTLSNRGTIPITGLTLSVSGDYAVTLPCSQTQLSAGASCTIQVTFTPATTGSRAGTLTVASSDPGSPLSVSLGGTGVANAEFVLTVDGGGTATATVTSGNFANLSLLVTPIGSFAGSVSLTCNPAQTVAYASCSLLPSQVSLAGGAVGSTVTINTEESNVGVGSLPENPRRRSERTFFALLLPGILLIFRRDRSVRHWLGLGLAVAALMVVLPLAGCGAGGGSSGTVEHDTLPGQYQFQISASSTSGPPATQTVTVSLFVTSP